MFNNSESRFWRSQVLIIFGILIGLNLLAWVAVWELWWGSGGLEVTFFDVGQGDAALTIVTELTLLYSG